MFTTSTQQRSWMFSSEEELNRLSIEANWRFIEQRRTNFNEQDVYSFFLTAQEERILCKYYEGVLRDFCKKFRPPMPKSVVAIAFQYFKRFYLNNSVMDYHPKNILVTCVYLACKVDEFNVSMTQFVSNIKGDREKAADIILNNELLLMQQLKYHLTVYHPLRAIEGFLIDIKTRLTKNDSPEEFRQHIDSYIDKCMSTNACFLFSPSQIALASVFLAATKMNVYLDTYIDMLFGGRRDQFLDNVKSIIAMINQNQKEVILKDQVKTIEKKLEDCRNQQNNPDSQEYKRALDEEMNEDETETVSMETYTMLSEETKRNDELFVERHGSSKN